MVDTFEEILPVKKTATMESDRASELSKKMVTRFPSDRQAVAPLNPSGLLDENKSLRTRLDEMEKVMRETKRESDRRISQLCLDAAEIGELKNKVAELEKLVQEKDVTIANQESFISDLNARASAASSQVMPPGPLRPGSSAFAPLSSTPLSFESGFPGNPMMYGHMPTFDPSGVMTRPASSLAFGPSGGPIPQYSAQAQYGGGMHPLQVTNYDPRRDVVMLAERLDDLFRKTEWFAWAHANVPKPRADRGLEGTMRYYVRNSEGPAPTQQLLGSNSTRYFLVAKMINLFFANRVLKPSGFKGFDVGLDAAIDNQHRHLFASKFSYPMPEQHTKSSRHWGGRTARVDQRGSQPDGRG